MILLDGKKLSGEINEKLKDEIEGDIDVPGLAVILIDLGEIALNILKLKEKYVEKLE